MEIFILKNDYNSPTCSKRLEHVLIACGGEKIETSHYQSTEWDNQLTDKKVGSLRLNTRSVDSPFGRPTSRSANCLHKPFADLKIDPFKTIRSTVLTIQLINQKPFKVFFLCSICQNRFTYEIILIWTNELIFTF